MESTSYPAVTVVIATRSRPELLRVAVDAALAQDYPGSIEVIAVFDQAEPADGLQRDGSDRCVRVLSNDRTPGLPGARNTGILAGKGELLAFCDDDDVWLPSKLTRQVDAMRAIGCQAAVSAIQIRYGESVKVRTIGRERLQLPDLVRARVAGAHPSTYLANRAFVLDKVGLVDEEIPGGYGEDYDWLLRVARASDIAVVDEPLIEVLWHPGSFFTRRWETIVEALQYVIDKHPEIRADDRGLARIKGQQAFALAALGRRKESWKAFVSTAKSNPRERRLLATLPVLLHLVSADTILHAANKVGRGI